MLLERGFGLAQHNAGLANAPDTLFDIGSIDKALTATAVFQLAGAGRLVLCYSPDRILTTED